MSEHYQQCDSCRFSETQQSIGPDGKPLIGQSQLVCKRFPPNAVAITVPSPNGMSVQIISTFPPVTDAMYCYEFAPENGAQDAMIDH